MHFLRYKIATRPLGVWIGIAILSLFLVGAAIRPFILSRVVFLEGSGEEMAIATQIALAGYFVGFPLTALGLVGVVMRRLWGLIFAAVGLLFTPTLAIVFLLVLSPPTFLKIGILILWLLAFVGMISLFANRRWFDEYLCGK